MTRRDRTCELRVISKNDFCWPRTHPSEYQYRDQTRPVHTYVNKGELTYLHTFTYEWKILNITQTTWLMYSPHFSNSLGRLPRGPVSMSIHMCVAQSEVPHLSSTKNHLELISTCCVSLWAHKPTALSTRESNKSTKIASGPQIRAVWSAYLGVNNVLTDIILVSVSEPEP